MIPKKQLVFVHFNHNGSVTSTFDESAGSGSILTILLGQIHLNPVRIVAGLEKSAHLGGTNL
jgi:hypothetical protein